MIYEQGHHCALRQASVRDVDLLMNWENDPMVMEGDRRDGKIQRSDALAFLERNGKADFLTSEEGRFVIETLSHHPLGFLDFFGRRDTAAEIGILIYDYTARNLGFARCAIECFKSIAPELGLTTLLARIEESNLPSISLFSRCGFSYIDVTTGDSSHYYSCRL